MIKKETLEQFINYCRSNLNLDESEKILSYSSLTICLIDDIYSLRSKYYQTTVPVVQRYADRYMGGDRYAAGDTLENLIKNINKEGGCEKFATNVLKNKQKLSGQCKASVVNELAKTLKELNIDNLEDFKNYQNIKYLEFVIKSVKGVGPAALNYLFMLAGDPNRCKPDVQLHRCIEDACGIANMPDEECQVLMTEAASVLKKDHEKMTVALLDRIIWEKYQSAK